LSLNQFIYCHAQYTVVSELAICVLIQQGKLLPSV
jgi:hypothetical protein